MEVDICDERSVYTLFTVINFRWVTRALSICETDVIV